MSWNPQGGQRSVSDVPTLYHRARFLMVGTLSLCPPYGLRTDLPCAQVQSQRPTATKPLVGQITKNLSIPSRKNIPLSFSRKSFA
jgi:hypothetical protein